jgi:hypothetical protein
MKQRKYPQRISLNLDKPLQRALHEVKMEFGMKDTQTVYYVLRKALDIKKAA